MGKRVIRGFVAGLAGLLVFALSTAHAGVGVEIDTPNDSVVFSLPDLPELEDTDEVDYPDVDYPAGVERGISGTAIFDSPADGGVLYEFIAHTEDGDILVYSGDADASCTASPCAWAFNVPWAFAPGEYELKVTASEPNPSDPDVPFKASDSISITVL